MKKKVPTAQTTQNASFGLDLAAATHPNPRHAVKTQIEPENISQYKKTAKKKETCTDGPNDTKRVVWARSRHHHPPKPSSCCQNTNRTENISQYKKNQRKKIKPSFGADLVIATHDPLGEGNPTAGSCLQARRMEVEVVVNKPTPSSRLRARRVGVVVVGGW